MSVMYMVGSLTHIFYSATVYFMLTMHQAQVKTMSSAEAHFPVEAETDGECPRALHSKDPGLGVSGGRA